MVWASHFPLCFSPFTFQSILIFHFLIALKYFLIIIIIVIVLTLLFISSHIVENLFIRQAAFRDDGHRCESVHLSQGLLNSLLKLR